MLCDATNGRLRYLRSLKVGNLGRNIYGVAGTVTAALFQNAKYLESLELSNVDFFTYDKRIPQAISSYTSLRNMTLGTVSDNTSMMFLEMCSPLKKLTVDFGRIHDWGYSPVDPLPRHSRTRLKRCAFPACCFPTLQLPYTPTSLISM